MNTRIIIDTQAFIRETNFWFDRLSQAAKKTRVERLRIAKTDFMLFLLVIFRYTIPHPVSGPGICLREYGR